MPGTLFSGTGGTYCSGIAGTLYSGRGGTLCSGVLRSPTLRREIDRQLARVVLERDDVLEVVEGELGAYVSSGGGG